MPEQVLAHIRAQAGKHFDPRVVKAFLKLIGETRLIFENPQGLEWS
jgi:HD-GYP domain-containing protein (c-di-GMP phosphodiesterase class II)